MYKNMLKKRNQKGFTLMEMLIVVAIIAILVAISIPVFNTQLNKAKANTDLANERAAKAMAVAGYLTADTTPTAEATYYYDAVNGTLVAAKPAAGYGKSAANNNKAIKVTVAVDGTVTTIWE